MQMTCTGIAASILTPATGHGQNNIDNSRQKIKLGLASYSLREFSLDETLDMTKKVGLQYIALKSIHLPLNIDSEGMKTALDKISKSGIVLYGGGVIYMKNETEVNQAFEYAKAAGMNTIIGVPMPETLELVEKKVKECDIRVAIHNHGPGDKVYPTPETIHANIKDRDPRIGICIDIGHTTRSGVDPSEAIEQYADRLLDLHIKDVNKATADGATVEIGRGIIDIPRVLKTLLKIKYDGVTSFEYEKDGKNPLPGLAESVGYVKGVLATL